MTSGRIARLMGPGSSPRSYEFVETSVNLPWSLVYTRTMEEDIKDENKFTTPLTLGEFRRMTAHLPDDAVFVESAHSDCRVVMASDIKVSEGPVAGDNLIGLMDDLSLGEDDSVPGVVNFTAWD